MWPEGLAEVVVSVRIGGSGSATHPTLRRRSELDHELTERPLLGVDLAASGRKASLTELVRDSKVLMLAFGEQQGTRSSGFSAHRTDLTVLAVPGSAPRGPAVDGRVPERAGGDRAQSRGRDPATAQDAAAPPHLLRALHPLVTPKAPPEPPPKAYHK